MCERNEDEPGMSVWCLSQQTNHTCKTVHHTLQSEGMYPYCISTLQELQPLDFEKCCNFCTWLKDQFGNNVEEEPIIFLQMRQGFTRLAMLIVTTIESGLRITTHVSTNKLTP